MFPRHLIHCMLCGVHWGVPRGTSERCLTPCPSELPSDRTRGAPARPERVRKVPPLSTHFCRANHLLRTLRGGGEQASHTHTQHVPHSHTRCTCCALILCFLCEPPPSLPYSVNDSNDSNGENGENGEHGQQPFQVRRGSRCCTQFLCVLLCPMLCTRERVLGLLC